MADGFRRRSGVGAQPSGQARTTLFAVGPFELPRELPPHRDADHHPDPGLLSEQRPHRGDALVLRRRRRRPQHLRLVLLAEPAALVERLSEDPLQLRRDAGDTRLRSAKADEDFRIGERHAVDGLKQRLSVARRNERLFDAMMSMRKIDIAAIEAARRG